MSQKNFNQVASAIFTLVAFMHLWRVVTDGNVNLMGWEVPLWFSWVGLIIAGYLAYSSYKLTR